MISLTPREREILSLLAQGCENSQIAAHLGTSVNTIRNQLTALRSKCAGVGNTVSLLRFFYDIELKMEYER